MLSFYIGVLIGMVIMYVYYNYSISMPQIEGLDSNNIIAKNNFMKTYLKALNVNRNSLQNGIYKQYADVLSAFTGKSQYIEVDELAIADGINKRKPLIINLQQKDPLYIFVGMTDKQNSKLYRVYSDDVNPIPFITQLQKNGTYTFNQQLNDIFGDPAYGIQKKLVIQAVWL